MCKSVQGLFEIVMLANFRISNVLSALDCPVTCLLSISWHALIVLSEIAAIFLSVGGYKCALFSCV